MAEDDIGVGDARHVEREAGAEREMVDDHLVGLHPVDDVQDGPSPVNRLPQQIGAPCLGLVAQRRHRAVPGGGEEATEGGVLAGWLLFGPDDTGFEPLPSTRSARWKPNWATMPAVAGPVATTTGSPASRHAVARVASGSRCDA